MTLWNFGISAVGGSAWDVLWGSYWGAGGAFLYYNKYDPDPHHPPNGRYGVVAQSIQTDTPGTNIGGYFYADG